MTKAKPVYTIMRYWEEDGLTGIDAISSTRDYSDAVKIIEDMVASHPYTDWEAADSDKQELALIKIEDIYDYEGTDRPPLVMDVNCDLALEASCKYKIGGASVWTYAYFYVVETDIVKYKDES